MYSGERAVQRLTASISGHVAVAFMVVVISFSVCPSATAQDSARVGAKAAVNVSWFAGSDWNDALSLLESHPDIENVSNDSRIGIIAGAFVEVPLAPNFAFQSEVLYANVGGAYSYDVPSAGMSFDGTISATALKLPLLLKPSTSTGDDGALFAIVGPTPIFIPGDITLEEAGGAFSVSASEPPDNRFVLAASLGAGYQHTVGSGAITLEFRYNRTFTDIFRNDNTRISGINIYVGYGFDV